MSATQGASASAQVRDRKASEVDVLVIGGGAAGTAAAAAAAAAGSDVLLVEREGHLGGILEQCIHNGFGLHRFGEELTGPEYAARDVDRVMASERVQVLLDTSVLAVTPQRRLGVRLCDVTLVGPDIGQVHVRARSVVFACGCRERSRGAINIAGTRPAGVFTAGAAQRLSNCDGVLVGKRVVILGSGDIGLIMARRMTWSGAKVLMVCELAAEPGGLRRNIAQCLDDYDIPLHLSTTVTRVFGHDRLSAVELADVDPTTMQLVPGTRRRVECDCLLLSVGLIPENAIADAAGCQIDRATSGPCVDEHLETTCPGVFVCGNELHVHDLVDFVSEEGEAAGNAAAAYAARIRDEQAVAAATPASGTRDLEAAAEVEPSGISVLRDENVGSITPQRIVSTDDAVTLRLRVRSRVRGAAIEVRSGGHLVKRVPRRVVVPSEMQTVRLSAKDLAGVSGSLEVSCISVPGADRAPAAGATARPPVKKAAPAHEDGLDEKEGGTLD
ncbi:MAG: FAD-dependent oxidoreductase [Atopobiaceae bacterium]|jgi:NADPH-dependent 2,4-dienoyl-CoA reductase/sulfur reductase-like enzyme|nr:NAD(P)/FAD-dependent oxidoreductase [Atopobiaceae bacterium]MCH4181047.1 NAD(P)/FAD-dependent oxidoreductase [Atopobiaceae bacterium]MCH4213749.1 NAD(P)/FAD-dependent oxidoreductase [Atopobiaceae bacterium]MCH4230337.1 NAD(P)/FAD-dependent oxidoreductase [Atopobiaceae bacterium]MCH4277035.1 NAD(P)/FAD-dependent oxidoreductase [Atopobiaceae bacterium]